ncbi:hypothetical protein HY494_02530 [Candidatus Woesearchaeota archaeon]|nr:hypothetical protein [Candidatus Woesearchaeota archaeon]
MFRFCARKPGQNNEDPSLVLVYKALDNCERSFDENSDKSQDYFHRAETLYNHWRRKTGREDYEASRKIDDLWMGFMGRIDALNAEVNRNLYK